METNIERRFAGVQRLYGNTALARFAHAHVAVIGIGGVGSWAVEALARSGVGNLTLIDPDHITPGNINRQIHTLHSNYGQAKVQAMGQRIASIYAECKLTLIEEELESSNLDSLLGGGRGFDYIIDAIDSVRTKVALIGWSKAQAQRTITVGGAGGRIDPTRVQVSDLARTQQDPLLAKVRTQLRKHHGFARGPKSKFNVSAVWSDEPLIYPDLHCDANADAVEKPSLAGGLHCGGLGSSVCVTASFGFTAAAWVLKALTV
jgi:tRNA A37 threonylcarbamoyladenosine dehydratase